MDGKWTIWSDWSTCDIPDSDCGSGLLSRIRTCEGVMHGGVDCPGEDLEAQECAIPCERKSNIHKILSNNNSTTYIVGVT